MSKDGELKPGLVTISQTAEQIESTETYREWAGSNLESLDFEKNRIVLQALDIRVVLDEKKVVTRDFLPLGSPSSSPAFPTP